MDGRVSAMRVKKTLGYAFLSAMLSVGVAGCSSDGDDSTGGSTTGGTTGGDTTGGTTGGGDDENVITMLMVAPLTGDASGSGEGIRNAARLALSCLLYTSDAADE